MKSETILPKSFPVMDDSLFRLAFESSNYGVIFLDTDQKVIFWNEWISDKSKIDADMANGKTLLDLFPEIAGARIVGAIMRSYSGVSTVLSSTLNKHIFPLLFKEDNGEINPLLQSVTVRPFVSNENNNFCMVQINDVTAAVKRDVLLKKYIGKAQGLSRLKSEFISTVSHELRTPLTSINGSLLLLSSGSVAKVSPEAKTLIDIALNNTDRLMLLINDILDMEKIEAGKMDFVMVPVLLGPIIQKSIECNRPYAEKYQVSLKLTDDVGEVMVFVDVDRLMQVLSNLLSNASKFSNSGDEINIVISRDEDEFIRITVKDKGQGIPKGFEGSIFEKFSQADGSDRRVKGGTGLGLSICQSIVKQMSGTIGFYNNPDGGASFFVNLKEINN